MNLNYSRSGDKDGVVVNWDDASAEINFIVKSYGDALKTSVRHRPKSHVVFGNSNSSVMKDAPELYSMQPFLVLIVRPTLTEDDLKSFLTGKHIVFNGVKCYSKDHSLSKTFKLSLSPTPYTQLHNPTLWGIGNTFKRFFERNSK